MKDIIIKLINGKAVKAERGSFVLEVYNGGKWNNLAVFEPTDEGFAMAENTQHFIENSRIERFY